MEIGAKVKIKDGSYMTTVNKGRISHRGEYESTKVIGWCKDVFTILRNEGDYPLEEGYTNLPKNDTMIVNDVNGEVWYCNSRINLARADPEPKFKVGDWVIAKEFNNTKGYRPYRLMKLKDSIFTLDDNTEPFAPMYFSYFRLATPTEIETHLMKVAKEKGYKEGVKIYGLFNDDITAHGSIDVIDSIEQYCSEEDSLDTYNGFRVYCKGKWAEIIPSKKKLPQTQREFVDFVTKCENDFSLPFPPSVYEFLNDYED